MVKPNSAFLNTDQMSPVVHYRPGCPPALTDTEIADEEGDELGKAIQQQHEEIIRTARPEFRTNSLKSKQKLTRTWLARQLLQLESRSLIRA